MLAAGVVERDGQYYRVGAQMFALSSQSREAVMREAALPYLHGLSRRCGHTLHLAVLCGTDVLYLEKLDARATAASPSAVGARVPAHCTAAGKVLLAAGRPAAGIKFGRDLLARTSASIVSAERLSVVLDCVAAAGYATDREEAAPGLCCLAVPVRVNGTALAALSIAHCSTARLPDGTLSALRETAAAISRKVAAVPSIARSLFPQ
jgi:DNA-binding IclR family transcriptional regulator